MKLHSLKTTPGARHAKMRVGRGMSSGKGKTSGRGHKGQYARSGHKHKLGFEGGQMRLIRRLPKRGFTSPNPARFAPVNVGDLDRFETGSNVTSETLVAAGLVRKATEGVKILGGGTLGKALKVIAQAFSASARSKIEAAGGTCEVAAFKAA
jgi:large subunit ribosomal protein L15